MFYLGFSLVASRRRRAALFSELITHVTRDVEAADGMCSWDICMFNNQTIGLVQAVENIIDAHGAVRRQARSTPRPTTPPSR